MKKSDDYLQLIIKGLAHDLNNILTITMGNISLLELYTDDENENLKSVINASLASCERAQELIQQLNSVSKFGDSSKKIVSIVDLIGESLSYYGNENDHKIELIKNSESCHCNVNPDQIKQVFENLILNAIQSFYGKGHLRITLENVELEKNNKYSLRPGHYIKVVFNDNGIGLSNENKVKIFNKKFSTKKSRSGLGLMISKMLTHYNHGYIDFESQENIGSTFNVILPSASEQSLKYQENN